MGYIENHQHRRYNPLTDEWVLVSPHRTQRPWHGDTVHPEQKSLPEYDHTCYLCPRNTRANGEHNPDYKEPFIFENDYAALQRDTPRFSYRNGALIHAESEYGLCKVVCYAPQHNLHIADFDIGHIQRIIAAWCSESATLRSDRRIKHIQIFENRGAAMGASNPHPHGQIWANQSIPHIALRKATTQLRYWQSHRQQTAQRLLKTGAPHSRANNLPKPTLYVGGTLLGGVALRDNNHCKAIPRLSGRTQRYRTRNVSRNTQNGGRHLRQSVCHSLSVLNGRPSAPPLCRLCTELAAAHRLLSPAAALGGGTQIYGGLRTLCHAAARYQRGDSRSPPEETVHPITDYIARIENGIIDQPLKKIYSPERIGLHRQRWKTLLEAARTRGVARSSPLYLFRSPGRTEISGNHTDHNHGITLVATIEADIIASVSPRTDRVVTIHNLHDDTITVDLTDLSVVESERGRPAALVRGVAAALQAKGVRLHGFDAATASRIPVGKGLSSSAAFESLLATIWHSLDTATPLSSIELAKAGQFAENNYFGKPCGLEDQLGSLCGGITKIDFANFDAIHLQKLTVDFADYHLQLAVVTGTESHAELTPHYAAIPEEMHLIASHFGQSVLRDVPWPQFMGNIALLRRRYGDRAVLRSLHFYRENERVQAQNDALIEKRIADFLALVNQSGYSSWTMLQNCVVPESTRTQEVAVAQSFIRDFIVQHNLQREAACRIHGGGFAGAVQVYMPSAMVPQFRLYIESIVGSDTFLPLSISPLGATEIAVVR